VGKRQRFLEEKLEPSEKVGLGEEKKSNSRLTSEKNLHWRKDRTAEKIQIDDKVRFWRQDRLREKVRLCIKVSQGSKVSLE
jgi:hypothetical protein